MKRKIVSILLALILLQSTVTYTVYASSLADSLKAEQEKIKTEINASKQEKDKVDGQISEEQSQIQQLDASISVSEQEVKNLEIQISELEASISQKQKEMDEKQKEYDTNFELFSERLVVIYETGNISFLDVLFGSADMFEFITNYHALSELAKWDMDLLDSLEKQKQELEQIKKDLEEDKAQLDTAKADKEAKMNSLKAARNERAQKVNSLSAESKKLQADIDAHNAKLAQNEALIAQELKRIEEEMRNKNGGNGTAGLHFDGSFIWPCNNKYITSTVKNRWGRKHKGIDIGASYENVYASASGYAYTLENPTGYGHYIIIIHGSGYMTLYGHLNAFKVSYGQYVSQGQIIAQSGNTGSSQGAHLHFEIRKASSISNFFNVGPLNPLDYLPGGYTLAPGATTES